MFIFIALLMVAVPLLLLAANFLRPPRRSAEGADVAAADSIARASERENIRAAKERLARLADMDGGALNTLSAEERAEYEDEIKMQLLADTVGAAGAAGAAGAVPAVPTAQEGKASIIAGIALCALVLLMAPVIYFFYGTPQAAMPAAQLPSASAAPSAENMARLVQQLQQRVEENPQDGEGMVLLAASMMLLNRHAEAADYYGRARALLGDEPRLLAGQLEALMAVESASVAAAEVEPLLQLALSIAPAEPYFLWLAGVWARKNGDSRKALSYFNSVAVLVEDAQSRREVEAIIADIEQEIGASAAASESAPPARAPTPASLRVQVVLAAEVAAQAEAGDTVFIFAKAVAEDAPAMPLAVRRVRVADLPLTVTLDDTMAMTPAHKLSDFEEYEVVARISKNSTATAARGDLFGSGRAVAGGHITITISQKVE